jgi:hypothetical protein
MSCLYSSPEVKRTKMKLSLGTSGHDLTRTDSGADHAITDVVDHRAQQNAFPTRRHMPANPVQLSPVFLRRSSSAKSGFRSLCGHEQRSSISHRAQLDQRFGTFQPA